MFEDCCSLEYLPNISNWCVDNIRNMAALFSGCSALKSLPDIAKWRTANVDNMGKMFNGCSSLASLPNIFFKIIHSQNKKILFFKNRIFQTALSRLE